MKRLVVAKFMFATVLHDPLWAGIESDAFDHLEKALDWLKERMYNSNLYVFIAVFNRNKDKMENTGQGP